MSSISRSHLVSKERFGLVATGLAMVAMLAGCAGTREVTSAGSKRLPVVLAADTNVIRFTLPPRAGVLTGAQLAELAPRVATIRTEPTSLTLRVGDSVYVQSLLRAYLVDSAGKDLGEIYRYDFAPRGLELWMVRDGRLMGRQMGVGQYTISFPRQYWKGDLRARPSVTVPITVTPTGRTSPPVVIPAAAPPR